MSGTPPPDRNIGSPVVNSTTNDLPTADSENPCRTVSLLYGDAFDRYWSSVRRDFLDIWGKLTGLSAYQIAQAANHAVAPERHPDFDGVNCGFGCLVHANSLQGIYEHVQTAHPILVAAAFSGDQSNIWAHLPVVFGCPFGCRVFNLFRPEEVKLHVLRCRNGSNDKSTQTDGHDGQEPGSAGADGQEPPMKKARQN